MLEYLKILIKQLLQFNLENSTDTDIVLINENLSIIDENEKKDIPKINAIDNFYNKINFLNLSYLIGLFLILGINIYLYNNNYFFDSSDKISKIGHFIDMDIIGNYLFRLSAEISKFCTVKSWDIIHTILKDLEKNSYNKDKIINDLEILKKMNTQFPGEFSLNTDSFEKCLIKLIDFLKEIL